MVHKLKKIPVIITVIVLMYLLGFVFFVCIDRSWMQASDLPSDTKVDAIVVLTGGEGRVATGVDLLKRGYAPTLFISGADSKAELIPDVARLLQTRIFWPEIGYIAQNTEGNAAETKDWIKQKGIKSIILVTSNYHMLRSLLEFKGVLPKLKITPVAFKFDSPKRGYFHEFQLMVKEYSKSIVVALRNCWKRWF